MWGITFRETSASTLMLDHNGDANNMVSDAVWTAEKPTKAGWYWMRAGDYTNIVCLSLHEDSDGMGSRLCVEVGPDDLLPLEEYELRAQWLGPITPDSYQRGRVAGLREAVWPNVKAPAMYENPDPGWEDPQMPDLTRIWRLAHEVGYAVGLHGSLKRDMDLIAAPWTEQAVGNAAFVDHLCAGLPAKRIGGPEHKPYGRVAVTLQIDGYFKPIDLSIVPRMASQIEQVQKGQTP